MNTETDHIVAALDALLTAYRAELDRKASIDEAGHCPEGYRQGHEAPCARWFGLGQLYLATAPTRRPKETLTP